MNKLTRRLALMSALALAACAPGESSASSAALVVPLPDGGELRLDGPAQRVLPTNASALDYVLALVGAERLAGVPITAMAYSNSADQLRGRELPEFVDYNAESALAHDPDLIVTHDWQSQETTELLRESGIPVLVVPDLVDLDDVRTTLHSLGVALGAEERASALWAELEQRAQDLRAQAPQRGARAMTYTNYGTGGFTAGLGTSADLMLELAGLRNAASEAGMQSNSPITHEELLTLDPELIVVSSAAEDSDLAPTVRLLRGEELLSGLRALEGERLLELPARYYSSSSLHVLDAAEELARLADEALARDP